MAPGADVAHRLSLLCSADEIRLQRARTIGVKAIQLRLGPGFPIPLDHYNEAAVAETAARIDSLGLSVESVGCYRNHLHPDPAQRLADASALRNVFRVARQLGVYTVCVFAGRDPELTVEENIPRFVEVWSPLADEAHEMGLRIAFENCTMYKGYPVRGINLSYSPHSYSLMFEALPHPALGIEYDPSHCIKQRIDGLRMIRQFADRIFHVHLKDHEILPEAVQLYGSYDTRCSRDRFPGLGQVDFAALFETLRDIGYTGHFALEGESDPTASTEDEIRTALAESVRHLARAALK